MIRRLFRQAATVARPEVGEEMTSSGIGHVDLRVGVLMHRWPWIGSLADTIGAFRAGLSGRRGDGPAHQEKRHLPGHVPGEQHEAGRVGLDPLQPRC